MNLIRVRKTLAHHGSQLDLVSIAQKARQRRIDEDRLGNLQRRARVASKLALLGLSHSDDPIRRQVIGGSELKRSAPLLVCFQVTLPERQSPEFFPNIRHIANLFLAAITNSEAFLSEALARDLFLIRSQRLEAPDTKLALIIE